MMDWTACSAVERSADTLSGAWRFKNTRVPVKALFENLESGATVDQFAIKRIGPKMRIIGPRLNQIAFLLMAGFGLLPAQLFAGPSSFGGNLVHPRAYHTANLLNDGRVLLAGGYLDSSPWVTNTAEFYNPVSNSWTATGNLNVARYFHAAALLPNGKALVAGGQTLGANDIISAELYDPATGVWALTGNMSVPRSFFSALLLPNGKVLVAGGISNSFATAIAELYDSASGTWSATGTLNQGRARGHLTLAPQRQSAHRRRQRKQRCDRAG